jgi:Protein of unknown function (DUF3311)
VGGEGQRRGESATPARAVHKAWYWLLAVPLVGLLIPPVYNAEDPAFVGIPFFYWYQLAWVPIGVAITAFVYRRTRRGAP